MAVTRYQGFMSYSHAADGKLAPAIHSALHRIAKPWYRLRSMRVFRDKSSLSANPALWPTIQQALGESDFFLLLASPEAANSRWVQQEVAWWVENRPGDKVLVLLTGGDLIWDDQARDFDWSRTTALPASLRGRFANEPLWTDFRWARTVNDLSLRHSQFRGAILDLAAPLLGRPKDEIDGDDVRQHRRLKVVSWAAMLMILAFAVTAVWQAIVARAQRNEALLQRQRAEERERIAVSRQLAAQADLVERETSNVTVRSLLSIEAARRSQNGDSIEALTRSLAVLPRVRVRDQGDIFATALSPDGRLFAIGIQGKRPQSDLVRVLKMADGRPLGSRSADIAEDAANKPAAVATSGEAVEDSAACIAGWKTPNSNVPRPDTMPATRRENLIRPQRVDGRHAHAAARGHVRRDRRDDEQDQRGDGERPRIERFDLVQQSLEQPRERAGRDQPRGDADRRRGAAPGRARGGSTDVAVAPSAMRTPISCVRSRTEYAITP